MSYIQIDIGGKLRGWKGNQMTVILMAQYSDLQNYEVTASYAMVYAGLKANCYVKREETDFTFEEVCDWVEELPEGILLDIVNMFTEIQAYKNLIKKGEDVEEELTKKKLMNTELKT